MKENTAAFLKNEYGIFSWTLEISEYNTKGMGYIVKVLDFMTVVKKEILATNMGHIIQESPVGS